MTAAPLPETVHDWRPGKTETVIKNDGRRYERRCHSKMLSNLDRESVAVIFQNYRADIATLIELLKDGKL